MNFLSKAAKGVAVPPEVSAYIKDVEQFRRNINQEGFTKWLWRHTLWSNDYFDEDPLIVDNYWKVTAETALFKDMAQKGAVFAHFKKGRLKELEGKTDAASVAEREKLKKADSFTALFGKLKPVGNLGEHSEGIIAGERVSVQKVLNEFQDAYAEAYYCQQYQMSQGLNQSPYKTYKERRALAQSSINELRSEDRIWNPSFDSTKRRVKYKQARSFEGEAAGYDAMLTMLQKDPDWKKACELKAQKDKRFAQYWRSGQLDYILKMTGKEERISNDWEGVEETDTADKMKPTVNGLEAVTRAEARYYLAYAVMREYQKEQLEKQGKEVTDKVIISDEKKEKEKKNDNDDKNTDSNIINDNKDKDKKKEKERFDGEPLSFDSPEQAVPVIVEAEKRLKALNIEALEQKLRTMQRLEKDNVTGIENLMREIEEKKEKRTDLEAEISQLKAYAGDAWTRYEAQQKQGQPNKKGLKGALNKSGQPVGVPVPGANGQSRVISPAERQQIAAQEEAYMKKRDEEKGFWGRAWDWIKNNWGWILGGLLAIGGAIFGIVSYRNNKKKKKSSTVSTVKDVTNTVSKTSTNAKSLVNSVNKLTSSSASLGTKITALDKISSTVTATKDNFNSLS